LEFCSLLIDSACLEIRPERVRFFGVPELASSIAFLAIPWSLMSKSDKLRFRMSPLGWHPALSISFAILISLTTAAIDFLSLSIFDEKSHVQFYLQQAQLGIVLLLLALFFSILRYGFFEKPKINPRSVSILLREMRNIENSQRSYGEISEIISQAIPEIIKNIEFQKNPSPEIGSIIRLMSNAAFSKYVARENPEIAGLIAESINKSKCDPDIFGAFFYNFTNFVIEYNGQIVDGFLRSERLGSPIESPLGDIYRSRKILNGCSELLSLASSANQNQHQIFMRLVFSTYRFCISNSINSCASVSAGLYEIENSLRFGLLNYSSSVHLEIKSTNLAISNIQKPRFKYLIAEDNDDLVNSWIVVLESLFVSMASGYDGDLRSYGSDLTDILLFSATPKTTGNFIAKSMIERLKLSMQYNPSLDRGRLIQFLDAFFLRKSLRYYKKSTAFYFMARYWRTHSLAFKDSI